MYDDASTLADDASLVGSGLLDSTGVLELISHLEGELGFEFRDDELVGANFESIDRIVTFLSGQRRRGPCRSVTSSPGRRATDQSTALVVGEQRVGYARLCRDAHGLSAFLRHSGVAAGDRVLVLVPNSADTVVTMFATWTMGAITVVVDPASTPARLRAVVDDARPAAVIVAAPLARTITTIFGELGLTPTVVVAGARAGGRRRRGRHGRRGRDRAGGGGPTSTRTRWPRSSTHPVRRVVRRA